MTTVILCNQPLRLEKALRSVPGPFRFLNLMDTSDGHLMRGQLAATPGAQELSRDQLFRERCAAFTAKYIQFMAQVNAHNHSWHWWAMQFTSKNPLATTLCQDTSSFLLVADLAASSAQPLVVLTESPGLAGQVQRWAKGAGVEAINLVNDSQPIKRFIKGYTPAATVWSFMKSIRLWAQLRRYWPKKDLRNDHLVITTLTHPQSFPGNSQENGFRDAYFGDLVGQLGACQYQPLILAQMLERPLVQVKKLRALRSDPPIVPMESCLNLWTLLVCFCQALRLYALPARIHGVTKIDDVEIGPLVRSAVIDARHSGDLFLNLRVYYAAAALARRLRIARCLYPYENRSWEKMLIQGIRSASPATQLTGYQHASITPSHTNFFLGDGEAEITPLPDLILTTGRVTKAWLEREGNYAPGTFKAACALRQTAHAEPRAQRPRSIQRVLVALATNIEEYVGVLSYLGGAFDRANRYQVRVRPHPSIPLEPAVNISSGNGNQVFSASTGSLDEDLDWADVVLYASSTVGLEAISRGIPVVHLELGGFLETDPMFGWNDFKWSSHEPSELSCLLHLIESLPSDDFQARQRMGKEYAADYLTPVTAAGLRTFWEA